MFDNPVVGPPPPRVSSAGITVAAQNAAPDAATPPDTEGEALFNLANFTAPEPHATAPVTGLPGEVAARVNGTPIFVADVLRPYAPQLAQFRPEVSAEEFERMQRQLVRRDLPHYIETAVLVDAVLSQMDAAQKDAVNEQLDTIFEEQLAEMMQLSDVQSVPELEAKLKAAGSSLSAEMQVTGETLPELRKSWGERALSAQYLKESLGTIAAPTRTELLAEYHSREKDFAQPARVKWQQLLVSFAPHNGQDNARLALARARSDIQAGMSFDEAVLKHGDGPLAKLGGEWDWMQPDSVAEPELRDALKTLKKGEISGPIATEKAYMLVKVIETQPARTSQFEEVQDELRKSISERKKGERIAAVVEKIKSKAIVETMFDGEPVPGDAQKSPEAPGKTSGT